MQGFCGPVSPHLPLSGHLGVTDRQDSYRPTTTFTSHKYTMGCGSSRSAHARATKFKYTPHVDPAVSTFAEAEALFHGAVEGVRASESERTFLTEFSHESSTRPTGTFTLRVKPGPDMAWRMYPLTVDPSTDLFQTMCADAGLGQQVKAAGRPSLTLTLVLVAFNQHFPGLELTETTVWDEMLSRKVVAIGSALGVAADALHYWALFVNGTEVEYASNTLLPITPGDTLSLIFVPHKVVSPPASPRFATGEVSWTRLAPAIGSSGSLELPDTIRAPSCSSLSFSEEMDKFDVANDEAATEFGTLSTVAHTVETGSDWCPSGKSSICGKGGRGAALVPISRSQSAALSPPPRYGQSAMRPTSSTGTVGDSRRRRRERRESRDAPAASRHLQY